MYRHRSALLLLIALLVAPACRSAHPNRDPLGAVFPTVVGESLSGKTVNLPEDVQDRPTVLLIGYAKDAQFDADRWLFGLLHAETPANLREIPTVPGLFMRAMGGWVDAGMHTAKRSEEERSVIVVNGSDASDLAAFTGNQQPFNIRVLLLDGRGQVRWFHDRGFSASKLLEVDRMARELSAQE